MDDQQIRDRAAEPSHVRKYQKRLRQELSKLQGGLKTLNTINAESSSLHRPPIFVKPVERQPFPLAQGKFALHQK
jgi:hypothetical protein